MGIRSRRIARSITNLHHVECHIAALIRHGRLPPDVVLYLNNSPCRGSTPQERGCHEILPGILPTGSRLTVYTVNDKGQLTETNVYRGTGKDLT